jgi:hypothetical protein
MSLTSVDLPDPETPVTQVNVPSGKLDVEVAQVVLAAPTTSIDPPVAGRRSPGIGIDRSPDR